MPSLYETYGIDSPEEQPAAPQSDGISRGFKIAVGQEAPMLKGAVGLLGAVGEKAAGEGGIFTGIKNWGLAGAQQGMQALQPMQRETDDLDYAWESAKQGNLKALVDWAEYGVSYALGQAVISAGYTAAGAVAGSLAGGGVNPVTGVAGGLTG